MSQARVQKPAPAFTATAVFPNGEFKEIKLSDYKGQWFVLARSPPRPAAVTSTYLC